MTRKDIKLNILYKFSGGIIIFFTIKPHEPWGMDTSYGGVEISNYGHLNFIEEYFIKDIESYSEDLSQIKIENKRTYIKILFG